MSSRRLGGVLFLFSSVSFAVTAVAGCSDDDAKAAASDAGADVATEANRPAPPEDDAGTPKTCRERCEEEHPTALSKDTAIDACWKTSCVTPCIQEQATGGDAGAEGGATDAGGVDGGGACVSPVVTVSSACDRCTIAFCCAAWDGCFQDTECAALEACYQQCED